MPEIRIVKIDGSNWLALTDVLASVGRERAASNPMFVARIPSEERQQIRIDGRWTWLVTEFGAEWAAGQDWRQHGDPRAEGRDRANGRAHRDHHQEIYDERVNPGRGRPKSEKRAHEAIADVYRRKIRSGEIPPPEKLDGIALAAQKHSVSLGTISRAYKLLRDEGLVKLRPGRNGGHYVAERDRA